MTHDKCTTTHTCPAARAVDRRLLLAMARTHTSRAQVVVEKDDDLWVLFAAAERAIQGFVSKRPGDVAKFEVEVIDEHGKSTEDSVRAAQEESESQRTTPKSIRLFAYIAAVEPPHARPMLWALMSTAHLHFREDTSHVEGWEPKVEIRVDSKVGEAEVVGLAEVMRLDVQHAIDQRRAGLLPPAREATPTVLTAPPPSTPPEQPEAAVTPLPGPAMQAAAPPVSATPHMVGTSPGATTEPRKAFLKDVSVGVVSGVIVAIILAGAAIIWALLR